MPTLRATITAKATTAAKRPRRIATRPRLIPFPPVARTAATGAVAIGAGFAAGLITTCFGGLRCAATGFLTGFGLTTARLTGFVVAGVAGRDERGVDVVDPEDDDVDPDERALVEELPEFDADPLDDDVWLPLDGVVVGAGVDAGLDAGFGVVACGAGSGAGSGFGTSAEAIGANATAQVTTASAATRLLRIGRRILAQSPSDRSLHR